MGPEAHLPSARIHLGRRSRKLFFLAFSLRPSRPRGESAVPHSPPRRKERKESANKNSFQAAKDPRLSSTVSQESSLTERGAGPMRYPHSTHRGEKDKACHESNDDRPPCLPFILRAGIFADLQMVVLD